MTYYVNGPLENFTLPQEKRKINHLTDYLAELLIFFVKSAKNVVDFSRFFVDFTNFSVILITL